MMTNKFCLSKAKALIGFVIAILITACSPEKPATIAEEEVKALNKAKETAAAIEIIAQEQKDNIDEQAR